MPPKEKLLEVWLLQQKDLEYPTYFFADDSLVFGRAIVSEAMEIQRILKVYELSSDQQLNCTKTSLYFSPNIDAGTKERVKAMFGAQVIEPHESYLGLPSLVGRSKNNTFTQLKQKVANKVSGWKEKLLTHAGKEILIKSGSSCACLLNELFSASWKIMRGAYRNDQTILVGTDEEREETCLVELGQDVLVEGKRGLGF